MPKSPLLEIPQEEQAQMLVALWRARYGCLLALHILLWCAAGRNPTEIAALLLCSRSSVYRTVQAYQEGALGLEHDEDGRLTPPVRDTVLLPTLRGMGRMGGASVRASSPPLSCPVAGGGDVMDVLCTTLAWTDFARC
jgi:hypothetical protein